MNDKPYIVSGYMRTGTSMMMEALSAGGLEAVFDPRRDERIAQMGDEHYKPNPNGVFEINFGEYARTDFNATYAGKLVKVFQWALPSMKDCNIVIMLRDPEEIRESYAAMVSKITDRPNLDQHLLNNYDTAMLDIIADASRHNNVYICHYPLTDALQIFTELKVKGWPIDPGKAAAIFNPDLYRFRKDKLLRP